MVQKILKNPFFWGVIIVILVFSLASFFSFSRWMESQYFGKVMSVSGSTFTIEDKEVGKRNILVTPKTKVGKGREKLSMPSIGDEVLIIGKDGPNGLIEALGVRVVDNKFKKPLSPK